MKSHGTSETSAGYTRLTKVRSNLVPWRNRIIRMLFHVAVKYYPPILTENKILLLLSQQPTWLDDDSDMRGSFLTSSELASGKFSGILLCRFRNERGREAGDELRPLYTHNSDFSTRRRRSSRSVLICW